MAQGIIGKQALAIRKVLKRHLKLFKSTDRGRVYTFREIQQDIRSLVISEESVREAVDDRRLKRDFWFDVRSGLQGELGKVLLIIPKAQLYSKLSEFDIPDTCHFVGDAKTGTMFRMKGKPLIFTRGMYAFGFINSLKLDALVREIPWTEICNTYEEIILDYVDENHDLPVFNVTTFMIEYYMNLEKD